MGVGVGVGVGVGGHGGGGCGRQGGGHGWWFPATATATVPSGPVEAYAQASAEAAPTGQPTTLHTTASSANTLVTTAHRVAWGPCTSEIMEAARSPRGHSYGDWSEGGTTRPTWFDAPDEPAGTMGTPVHTATPSARPVAHRRKFFAAPLNAPPPAPRTHGRAVPQWHRNKPAKMGS